MRSGGRGFKDEAGANVRALTGELAYMLEKQQGCH